MNRVLARSGRRFDSCRMLLEYPVRQIARLNGSHRRRPWEAIDFWPGTGRKVTDIRQFIHDGLLRSV
jgi:hypothetical protein